VILIYPPVSRPCEPPAGIAKLSGALKHHGIKHRVLDANLEGLLFLLQNAKEPQHGLSGTWTRRAFRNSRRNLDALRDWRTYRSIDRYKRAVLDLNRALEVTSGGLATVGLANYQHTTLTPLKSRDLIWAAEHPEQNPFFPYFSERLRSLLEEEQPAAAGFSLNYLSQALSAFAMIGFLRKECPDIAIIMGGGLATSWMARPDWKDPFGGLIDQIVSGPGEYKLVSLLHGNRHGSQRGTINYPPLCPLPSREGNIKSSLAPRGRGLGEGHFPGNDADGGHISPDYDRLPIDDYLSPGPILPYSGSTGCYWRRCSFCPEKAEGNGYIPVPVRKAAADIDALVRKKSPALIHLLDSAVSGALMDELIKSPPAAPWYGFARVERRLADPDFCAALRSSGCVMLKLGIESGDQGVLDKMEKGVDLAVALRVLKALKQAGIATYVYFLFGTPAESLTEARKTLQFTVDHGDKIGFLNLAIFNLPVSAPDAAQLATDDFYDGDLSLYTDFVNPSGWNRKEVRLFIEDEFRKHPAVSSILRKEPPLFTSNHAPFFVPLCV
jgi:radical SAM superfamily enzyme YgiQ (UPF0313 family)